MTTEQMLHARNIRKFAYDDDGRPLRGSTVLLLSDASLELRSGEIHAIVGENGAGKTTLIKVVAGALPFEGGTLEVRGEPMTFGSTVDARAQGISVIWQEFSLAPHLSVVENMFLGRELRRRGGRLDTHAMVDNAREALRSLGVDIDPRTMVDKLSTSQQQVVEIAKAMSEDASVLILDEPTASLSRVEVERLFQLLRDLREKGLGIVLVTHRFDEVFAMADRATVLKDGRTVGTYVTREISSDALIESMVGRQLAQFSRQPTTAGDVVLRTKDLVALGGSHGLSIEVRAGEILGLAGLVGAGRTELARAIVGADPPGSGQVFLRETDVTHWSMRRRLDAGMAFVPEDRKSQGVVLPLSIQRNLAMPGWSKLGAGPFLSPRRERRLAGKLFRDVKIAARSVDQPVYTLSGGNQQRVAIGKWLDGHRTLYILDEPTRGVDVSARYALYELMDAIAKRGGAILMISSDMPEILAMSDRVYVMRSGEISAELSRAEATEQSLLAHMLPERAEGDLPAR